MTQDQGQALQKGEQIGVYEIKGVIHVGLSGIVYRIWNEHMNAVEALVEYFPCDLAKRLEDGHTVGPKSENERAAFEHGLKQFLEQAESLSDIEHPNIVRVHNELEFNDTGYLVMDDENGTPLSKLTESSASFSQTELEYILTSLLEGLQKVHELGTFHGDIHPTNILIRKNGEPVLIDFAAARLAISSHSDSAEQFLRAGYAPAELYDRGHSPGSASDLYSLGATIYRCITQTDPISAPERLAAIDNNEPDPLKSVLESAGSGYSETLLKTIFRMLCPDANERPQSAAEVLAELKRNKADAESAEGVHKTADDSQQLASTDLDQPRALWIGAAVIVVFIVFGLWSFQKDETQTEILVPETDMKTAAVLKKQEAQPVESPKEKIKPETAVVSGSEEEIKSDEISASVEKSSLLPSDQEQSAKSTDESHKPQELPTKIAQSPSLESKVVSTTDDKEELIKQHIAAAEEALKNFRFTTPPGDNANQHYQAILEIDPENVKAREGQRKIVDQYVWLIERAIKNGYHKKARIYLGRAEAILPDITELKKLRIEVNESGQ